MTRQPSRTRSARLSGSASKPDDTDPPQAWSRTVKNFKELVQWPDGKQRPRFVLERLGPVEEAEDLAHLFAGTTPAPRATAKE